MRHLVAPLLVVPLLLVAPAPAAHAAGTCQGLPATIESAGGGTVTGTEGPDVILVTAAADVVALGGDDTICVAGGTLDAGAGNDRVSAAGVHGQTAVLGQGDDTYVSAGLTDLVDPDEGDSAGTDHIDTNEGLYDEVGSGVAGEPNHDVISMDYGTVHLQAPAGSGAQLEGRPGLELEPEDAASYVVDITAGTIKRDGTSVAAFSDLSGFLEVSGRRARFTVHGSDHSDSVSVRRAAAFRADLGGAADSLYLYPGSPRKGRVDGGSGGNWLLVRAKDSAVGDLSRHTLTLTSKGKVSRWTVSKFANMDVAALRIDIRGSAAVNGINGFGCDVTLHGLGGKDHLYMGVVQRGWPPARRCPGGERGQRGHLYGDGANDELRGGNGPDVLVGGPGDDLADGNGGADHCEAEQKQSCES